MSMQCRFLVRNRNVQQDAPADGFKRALKHHWFVWVNGNWRVTFRFAGVDVELVGYQDNH